MFIGSDVRWRSRPLADKPGAEAYGFFSASCVPPTQMNRRARCYLHAQFLVHLPGERIQLCLAGFDVSTGQIPDTRVGEAVQTPVDEQDSALPN